MIRTILFAACICLTVCKPAAANAPYGTYGEPNPFPRMDYSVPFDASDTRIMSTILRLTDEQQQVLDQSHAELVRSVNREADTVHATLLDLTDQSILARDSGSFDRANRLVWEWLEIRTKLGDDFIAEVRLLLTPEQLEAWPAVEQAIRRRRLLPTGLLTGETLDLFRLIDETEPEWQSNPDVLAVLDLYAIRLDAALRAREEYISLDRMGDYFNAGRDDPEKAIGMYQEAKKLRDRVRRVNLEFLSALQRTLTPDAAKRIEERFYEQAIQARLSDSPILKRITATRNLPQLDEDQRALIAAELDRTHEQRHTIRKRLFEIMAEIETETIYSSLAYELYEIDPEKGQEWIDLYNEKHAEFVEVRQSQLELERSMWTRISPLLSLRQRRELPVPNDEYIHVEEFNSYFL
ncbi:MAG: hypothetical protein ACF8MJ_07715 [Phycisphaerales bacterium JB050]